MRVLRALTSICLTLVSMRAVVAQVGSPFAPPPRPTASQAEQDLNQNVASPANISPPPAAATPYIDYSVTPTPTAGEAIPLEGGEILAKIEGEIVLASDVLWRVNMVLEANRDQIPQDQYEDARRAILRQHVMGLIDTKVLYAEFKRKVPAENIPKIEESMAPHFEEDEVPRLCEALKLKDKQQLDEFLRKNGSSLVDEKRRFFERTIAGEWLRQLAPKPKPVTHDDLLGYYQEHLTDFEFPAQAKWEELSVHFERMNNDRTAAWQAICQMGNDVWQQVMQNPIMQGPVFGEIAKARSHGLTATQGGAHDWTTRGSLRSQEIDNALFTLQVGQMSDVIETEAGFHIVRVLDRHDAGRTPFTEAQAEIRKILDAKAKQELAGVELDKLRDKSRIWTVFDGEFRGADLTARQHANRQK